MSTGQPTVAILGGGQLARMLILAGASLGARFQVLDTHADVCAGQLAPVLVTDWQDPAVLQRVAQEADAVTFDWENVPAEAARWLTDRVYVAPNPEALATAQDRLSEKQVFQRIGLPVAPLRSVDSRADLQRALQEIGTPAILKTRRMGYDGKGQYRLHAPSDLDAAWEALGQPAAQYGLILEALVPFDYEVSVVAVRSRTGEFHAWPLTRNHHVDGILSTSLAPAPASEALVRAAHDHAQRLAEALDYVGVFALELFVVGDRLYGNEMAPRVHNSGHWTQDGAITSQFENHLRAVLGLPLGSTQARGLSVMLNWIGQLPDAATFLQQPDAHWHAYDKAPRPGRKVGHATVCAPDAATLRQRLQRLADSMDLQQQIAPVLAALG